MPTQTNIGSYKDVPIKPGTQAEVNAQVAAINAQQPPNPTVQANPVNAANLQGTMTIPQAPKAPVVPQVAPIGAPVAQPTKTDPMAFNQVISAMRDKLAQDDKLTKVKNLVFTQLYDRPLTSEEKEALTPALQHAMETGDRNLIDTEVRLLNDQIKGRTNTLDQSLKYLVDGYKESVTAAEKQKQDAIDNVLNFAQVYGSNAGTALKSLYGDQYLQSLKDMGIDVDNFSSLQTLAERKATETTSDTDILPYVVALQNGQLTLAQVPQKIRGDVLAAVQSSGSNKMLELLQQYKDTISGLNFFTANLPSNKALIDTLKGQITAEYKQQKQLGTLDAGVQTLVDKIIPDPSQLSLSALSNKAQIDAIDNFVKNQGGKKDTSSDSTPISGVTSSGLKYTITQ